MAKNKTQKWSEAELVDAFGLTKSRLDAPLLQEWLDTPFLQLNDYEQYTFNRIWKDVTEQVESWNEEDLKMNFLAFVIDLAGLKSSGNIRTFFEKTIDATVGNYYLKVKTDFMIARGVMDLVKAPFFHFQEYKKDKDPYGDPIVQLIEAFLIAQAKNNNQNPLYGCYVVGRFWYFVVMEGKNYCISKAYDSTDQQELLQTIAILRKFKEILETRLILQ